MQITDHTEFNFDGLVQKKDMLKQAFNAVYFFISAIVGTMAAHSYNMPNIWMVAAVFSSIALGACIKLYKTELHSSDLNVRLNLPVQNLLRISALAMPIPFFALYVAGMVAQGQFVEGEKSIQRDDYKNALNYLNRAVLINPRMGIALNALADLHNYRYEFNQAVVIADKAIALDPADSSAYASKAWALNSMHKRDEALTTALTAVKLGPANGHAQYSLAQTYYDLGEYELALPAAEQHIKLHRFETEAFNLRANVLEKLGQSDEASQDRYTADDLRYIQRFTPRSSEQLQAVSHHT